MKTHENRALVSKALLKATACLFLAAGIGISPVFATPGTTGNDNIAIVQQKRLIAKKMRCFKKSTTCIQ